MSPLDIIKSCAEIRDLEATKWRGIARSLVQDYERKAAVFSKNILPYDPIIASLYSEVAHDINKAFFYEPTN